MKQKKQINLFSIVRERVGVVGRRRGAAGKGNEIRLTNYQFSLVQLEEKKNILKKERRKQNISEKKRLLGSKQHMTT